MPCVCLFWGPYPAQAPETFCLMDWSGGALVGTWVDLPLYCAGNPLAKRVMMMMSTAVCPDICPHELIYIITQ